MANAYLSRTNGTPTNGQKMTFSTWIKLGDMVLQQSIFGSLTGGSPTVYTQIKFMKAADDTNHGSRLRVEATSVEGNAMDLKTTRRFRDPSAWYHLVVAFDTTQAVAGDRCIIYVNGVQETVFDTETYPTQNDTLDYSKSATVAQVMSYNSTECWTGCLAHTHFIDGLQYAASTFGETDSTSGIWIAQTSPSVTYGAQGFFLKYQDTAAFGDDSSGNTNDFTMSGTITQTKDSPDNNFCTMNAIYNYYQAATFSNGNNTVATANNAPSLGTMGVESGKWYWEAKAVSASSGGSDYLVGVSSSQLESAAKELGNYVNDYGYAASGNLRNDDGNTAYGNTYAAGDIIGVALDLTNMNLYFSKNGTWQNSGDPTSGATGTGAIDITQGAYITNPLNAWFPAVCGDSNGQNYTWSTNFGNGYFGTTAVSSAESDDAGIGSFEYDVPAGYYAICTDNLGDQS